MLNGLCLELEFPLKSLSEPSDSLLDLVARGGSESGPEEHIGSLCGGIGREPATTGDKDVMGDCRFENDIFDGFYALCGIRVLTPVNFDPMLYELLVLFILLIYVPYVEYF